MDKRVILAVAGSGKTQYIINQLSIEKRFLIVTYTINNYNSLRARVIKKFGYLPNNIVVLKYFNFLYSFCYKPLLSGRIPSKGISFEIPPSHTRMFPNKREFYFDQKGRLYSNRISKLLEKYLVIDDVRKRISKYYDVLCFDEVQDIGGRDFNFLMSLLSLNSNVLLVGDFFQHTYDTSRDGNVNGNLYKDLHQYRRNLAAHGLVIDDSTLKSSYRCGPAICDFIRNKLGVDIYSVDSGNLDSDVIFIDDEKNADEIYLNNDIVKLFYQESSRYKCFSKNWGESKGQDDYTNVCVVLNKSTYENYKNNLLNQLAPITKNKFYVACSRARKILYIIPESAFTKYKLG